MSNATDIRDEAKAQKVPSWGTHLFWFQKHSVRLPCLMLRLKIHVFPVCLMVRTLNSAMLMGEPGLTIGMVALTQWHMGTNKPHLVNLLLRYVLQRTIWASDVREVEKGGEW